MVQCRKVTPLRISANIFQIWYIEDTVIRQHNALQDLHKSRSGLKHSAGMNKIIRLVFVLARIPQEIQTCAEENALFSNIPHLNWWHLPGSKLLINYVDFSKSQVELVVSHGQE